MVEPFDPYYEWLGIPPRDRPADYYRLLGLRERTVNCTSTSDATSGGVEG